MQELAKLLMGTTTGDTMEYNDGCLDDSSSSTSSGSSASVLSFSPADNQLAMTQYMHNNEPPETIKKKKKLPSSKYKGVVPQSNGRWGAQLYNGHKRVWLGTFDRQDQAARAHDLAAIRFRGVHAAVNFSAHHYVSRPHHLDFLAAHSMVQVVAMLRTHTYQAELARFTRAQAAANRVKKPLGPAPRKRLFEKVLTASDVGKGTLHRLVIPKCHAERDLPALNSEKGMMLTFEDGGGERVWRFKYCYWKGSKNYVLTKGWSHFVKEKGLKPGDVVRFYSSVMGPHKRLYIDSSSGSSLNSRPVLPLTVKEASPTAGACGSDITDRSGGGSGGASMIRLFGVNIRVIG